MKRFTIALALCALPAMAAAQTVTCTECTHEVSVYMGEGGLVAQAPAGTEMVTFVSRCGGVFTSGQVAPNADDLVSMLFSNANGLACNTDDARFELGPVMDGGWFWITDAMNSAVGPLVNQSVLMNDRAVITSAGSSVTMMVGNGAVFMKEMSTGRVGILPDILPEAPMPAFRKCGYDDHGLGASPRYVPRNSNCTLGDGGTIIRARGPVDPFTGARNVLEDGATIVRPRAGSGVTVQLDTWGNGSGHFTTRVAAGTLGNPRVGHLGSGGPLIPVDFIHGYALPTGPGSTTLLDGVDERLGLLMSTDNGLGTLTVRPSEAHCGTATSPLNHSVTIVFQPTLSSNLSLFVARFAPPLRTRTAFAGAPAGTTGALTSSFNLTVACP